ncbi:Hypothetical predicted protein [Drosophila guanche]|uniref:Uncharacterized protein n=1 Tax=Drosophila guanche TaxID=7266 RepID=A0A3B0J848_DROGU|nr:Hypothetical predicted protein [Drosophila guanche]
MGGRRVRGSSMEISSEENDERESEVTPATKGDTSDGAKGVVAEEGARTFRALSDREDDDEDAVEPAYSPLADNAEEQLGNPGYCCEESLALLPHEMRCCSESGTDTDSECDISKAECQKLDGSLEYGLQHPYQLMHNAEECARDVQSMEQRAQRTQQRISDSLSKQISSKDTHLFARGAAAVGPLSSALDAPKC